MKNPLLAMLLAVLCLCGIVALGIALLLRPWPISTPAPAASPSPTRLVTGTEALLASTQIPASDPYDLARRLRHSATLLPKATPATPVRYSVGDREKFWVMNLDVVQTFQVDATLRYVSPHLYMWVQDELSVQQDALEQSARTFEERLYPTVRRYFGSEWSPGIDNDVRLTILHARFSGATGYFSYSDEYPSAVIPYSNQREMLYINLEQVQPGSAEYDATLAHEFQHMVHWFADANEDAWVTEGASELAMQLCGYAREQRANALANAPDTPLTQWGLPPDDIAAHYGASFLLFAYFAERFGPQMTRELVANPLNGIAGFDAVLQAHRIPLSFNDLFADWVIANYLSGEDSTALPTPYAYRELDVQAVVERVVSSFPASGDGTVYQYAADYIEFKPASQDMRLDFTGVATTTLVPNQAHSGRYQWWSNRGDNSDMTLTRSFDLRGLQTATLQVWLWYDIEEGWDYAYVEASTDGGATWQILPGKYTTTDNPSGNSYGPGYTGLSGRLTPAGRSSALDGSLAEQGTAGAPSHSAVWVQEAFDLSPFAGQQTLIRFEYLTDEAVNHPGLCVDDIRIPELGYFYDAEASDDGWVAQGFIRSDNVLPQRYIVQLIRLADRVSVERMPLQEDQSGTLTVAGSRDTERLILVVSAVTPGSSEAASYHYEIRPM